MRRSSRRRSSARSSSSRRERTASLHVSNVGPGRVGHIEDVINRGDILDVLVQEVDKARGRIGLKLIQKHENGNTVSPEELIERAKDAPPREPSEDRPPRDGVARWSWRPRWRRRPWAGPRAQLGSNRQADAARAAERPPSSFLGVSVCASAGRRSRREVGADARATRRYRRPRGWRVFTPP